MRERVTSLVNDHDGTIVPSSVVTPFDTRGSAALTMRYGTPTVHEHAEKACAEYTLHARRVSNATDSPLYSGRIESPTQVVRAFLFHTEGTPHSSCDDLDAAFTAFVLDVIETTNTDDTHWYVRPGTRSLCDALADYPYDFDSTTQPRSITFSAPATGDEFVRPSNLCVADLRFVAVRRAVTTGDVLLETDAPPDEVLDDVWFEKASQGVGDEMTLDVQPRDDGGTAFVVMPRGDSGHQ